MPKSKAPRKKYRPKPVLRDPVGNTIKGLNPANPSNTQTIQLMVHDAMGRLVRGEGTKSDWQSVADAINMTILLTEKGYGRPEWMGDILAARDAMKAVRDRHRAGKPLLFRGEEMAAVNEILDLHDQQIEVALVKDVEWALGDMNRRISHAPLHETILLP